MSEQPAASLRLSQATWKEFPSIAILPFVDLSQAHREGHFCEGFAEEIIQGLSRVDGLRVLSRTSSFLYKDSDLGPEEIAQHLGAQFLLTGSLQKEGARLAVRAELFAAEGATVVWSQRVAREGSDIFALVAELIDAIATTLGIKAPAFNHLPVNLEAYDSYLKGRHYYFWFSRQGMGLAIQEFEKALNLDATYAAAWAGLAFCAAYLYIYVDRSETHRTQAETASQRALALDPQLAEAHVARGVALSASGKHGEAEEAFETALRLDANLYEAYYFYARHCFAVGRPEEAIQYFEWAAALRPEDYQAALLVAQVYGSLGILDEAEAARRRGLALGEARLKHAPKDARAMYLGANALVALGDRETGLDWARRARSLDPDDSMLLYNLGCIHALAGELEEALDCLSLAVAAGLSEKKWFLHDGDLEVLHAHPRFKELVRSLDDES